MSVEPKRVLLVGDLHVNSGAGLAAIDHASTVGADLIIQLGDYGWWPTDPQGQKFIRKMDKRLAQRGLDLWWIDGNHEHFDRLATLQLSDDGRRQVNEHVWHLPRGYRWRWGNTDWLAVGGAVSVDKNSRVEGKTWFAAEELTDEEADSIAAAGPADVLIAHDAPLGVPFLRARLSQDKPAWRRESPWPTGIVMRSDEHQRRLRGVVERVEAKRLFHGHHHIRYSDQLTTARGQVQIEGLGMDLDPIAALCVLVDLAGQAILETHHRPERP